MTKYQEFDVALLKQIAAGRNTTAQLEDEPSGLRPLAEPHREKDRWGDLTPYFRVIDRRIQALRKKGLIHFNSKHWVLLEAGDRAIVRNPSDEGGKE